MEIQIGDRLSEINLISKDGDNVSIAIDGKIYNVNICMFANGQCSILNDGISYNPFIIHEKGGKHYSISLNYSVYEVDMLDSQAKYMRLRKRGGAEKQDNKISSPMPAKIIKIYVETGQQIKEGDFLLTFEAMKMQSTIQASFDCEIESVSCVEGDSVMAEQILMTLKPIICK